MVDGRVKVVAWQAGAGCSSRPGAGFGCVAVQVRQVQERQLHSCEVGNKVEATSFKYRHCITPPPTETFHPLAPPSLDLAAHITHGVSTTCRPLSPIRYYLTLHLAPLKSPPPIAKTRRVARSHTLGATDDKASWHEGERASGQPEQGIKGGRRRY